MRITGRSIIAAGLAVAGVAVAIWILGRSRQPVPISGKASLAKSPPLDAISPFYVGLSSLDVGENERAARLYDDLSKKLPDEPAIWANLGLARMRLGDFAGADESLGEAAKLAPDEGQIAVLQSLADENQGRFQPAIDRLRGLSNPNAGVLYRLSGLLDRTGANADPRGQLEVIDRLGKLQPGNIVVQFSRARLLARTKDANSLAEAINNLDASRANWGPTAVQQFDSAKAALAAGDLRSVSTHLTFLQNLSLQSPQYQAALAELGVTGASAGSPIREFLRYRSPEPVVSTADLALKFTETPDATLSAQPDFYFACNLGTNARASLISLTSGQWSIGGKAAFPASTNRQTLDRTSICAADLNGDALQDLAIASADGLKIWLQQPDGSFTAFHPPESARAAFEAPCHGVWAVDYDADGDMDLLVARDGQPPRFFRNNRDGTFTPLDTLTSFPDARDVCWADLDGDGNGDLAIIDAAGRVLVSWNNRAGSFGAPEMISDQPAAAISFGWVLGTGEMSLVALEQSGAIQCLTFNRMKRTWSKREAARWANPPDLSAGFSQHRVNLFIADMDNNGAPDIVGSAGTATAIWLNQGGGLFQRLDNAPAMFTTSIASLDDDGSLSLAGLTASGAEVARARGTKGYHWQSIQTRSLANLADGRINSFGIGGHIEIRAGPLLAAAPITSPSTHFGLGDQTQVGVARIIWPNGVSQAEFDLRNDQQIIAVQRLKGSCPWVFTRAGGEFHFVKDFIWRSPLGMRINSQDTAGVEQTEDWILIPGNAMSADGGVYEVRITAELWETHFFDHIALKVVDHPESTAALVDERFVPTQQPKLEVIATTPPRPFAYVRDQSGRDDPKTVAATDGDCLTNFSLGQFQGIAQDHWVEFQLPDEARSEDPLVLIGEGWIYPTDSSLNVAISQGTNPGPRGLVFEDYDSQLGWRAASGDLGFLAGKNKTVVIPLPRESLKAGRRRFRLWTNLEIYWDRLAWAVAEPATNLQSSPAEMLSADLHYRGFSELSPPDRRRPDIPNYNRLSGTGPRWQDLEGYYTRYGDVRELLQQTDDRYVIMNAGDELALRFAAPPPPPPGYARDFVLVGDGWVKDGDFNTANSRTVLPLPTHASSRYGTPSPSLEADPVFQRNKDDWSRFHTRYIAPVEFENGLMRQAAITTEPTQ